MPEISRVSLFGKLNSMLYKSVEGATVFCKLRGNPYVELVHWVQQILQLQDSDIHRILKHYEIDFSRLASDVTAALDQLLRGSTSINDFSEHIESAIERGWVYGSLMYKDRQVRGAYLLVGILKTHALRLVLTGISKEFGKLNTDIVIEELRLTIKGSPEEHLSANDGTDLGGSVPGEASNALAPAEMGKQQALKKYAVDLTEKARKGEIDPITGRDEEIRQIVDILMRRRQNNPLLAGEAGVGKTAVVEGFALRIAQGDVPPALKNVAVLALDIGLLQAGASMKGEFEQRLRHVIDEVQASEKPIILFVDEVHTLVGAGGQAGTGDAANLLKPALARGNLRTIGATTWGEYKKYIEKDAALTRRFQVVQVNEPSEEKAIGMLRGIATTLEKHHQVLLLDAAIEAAVKLSHRYIPDRQLPDKAVSLLDTACARVAVSQHAIPAEVEDCNRRIEALRTEQSIIEHEETVGVAVAERMALVQDKLQQEKALQGKLEARWNEEKELCKNILALQQQLRVGRAAEKAEQVADADAPTRETLLGELEILKQKLATLQGEQPLMLLSVDEQAVAAVVADWTGIPVGKMVKNELASVLRLAESLNARVIGQRHGLESIARRVQTSRARLDNPNKPIGVFLLCGPSGVGKTETALALAETLYGGEQNVITINMSEFQEAHTVSTLKGAPPGYVGYGEGGVLTEAVRRKPYSVVLLDEVEKAHPDVHEIFFQVFDKGWMEDGEGRYVDFKNTIIILTSNVGSDLMLSMCQDPELLPEPDALSQALREPLLKVFPAALLGRLVTIPYYPLSEAMLSEIVRLQLRRIRERIQAQHRIALSYDESTVKLIIDRCTEVESGGRMIDGILTNAILPEISREFLSRTLNGETLGEISIATENNQFVYRYTGRP